MGLRTKLKVAKSEIKIQKSLIAGLDRRNRFLLDLCEDAGDKIKLLRAENEVFELLVYGCAIAAGGKITVQTENLKQILEEYEITYQADEEKHTVSISVTEKKQG